MVSYGFVIRLCPSLASVNTIRFMESGTFLPSCAKELAVPTESHACFMHLAWALHHALSTTWWCATLPASNWLAPTPSAFLNSSQDFLSNTSEYYYLFISILITTILTYLA